MDTQKRVDPRTIRTKKMLKEAVFSLLADHVEISQLTVQKITSRAGLNRATFYLHYEDINDLLRQLLHEIFDDLSKKVEPLLNMGGSNEPEHIATLLSYFQEHRKVFTVIVEHKSFASHLSNLLKNTIEKRRMAGKPDPTKQLVSIDVMTSSLMGIMMWWIKDGSEYSAEYIATQMTLLYKRRYL